MHTPEPSPELRAIDLPRVDVESMSVEEIDAHSTRVAATVKELGDVLRRPVRGVIAQAVRTRRLKLQLHLAHVQDVRNAKLAAQAQIAFLQQAGKSSGAPGCTP